MDGGREDWSGACDPQKHCCLGCCRVFNHPYCHPPSTSSHLSLLSSASPPLSARMFLMPAFLAVSKATSIFSTGMLVLQWRGEW